MNMVLWYHCYWECGSAVCWGTMLQAERSRVRFPMRSLCLSVDLMCPAVLWPWGRLSLWQKWIPGIFLGLKGCQRVRLTTSPLYVSWLSRNMWKPWRLTTLWPSAACYRDSFTFLLLLLPWEFHMCHSCSERTVAMTTRLRKQSLNKWRSAICRDFVSTKAHLPPGVTIHWTREQTF
jgi:hypothetical protein